MTFTTFFWTVWLLSFAISILIGIFVVRKGSRASEQIELLKAIVKNQNKMICHMMGEPYVEEKKEEKINEKKLGFFDEPKEY